MAQSCLVDGSQEMLATADAFRGQETVLPSAQTKAQRNSSNFGQEAVV